MSAETITSGLKTAVLPDSVIMHVCKTMRTCQGPVCEVAKDACCAEACLCYADAFDDLVKQAVHAANAAAQERADFFASVAAAEMAAAMRGRVASKRSKRRTSSPKQSKNLTWAAAEQLVQQRVFSKVQPVACDVNNNTQLHCAQLQVA